jgi:thiamine biosynthesis lipoprotein
VGGHLAVLLAVLLFGTISNPGVLVDREAYVMDTRVRLVTTAVTRADGLASLERALGVLEATEAELSTWIADSALSRVNRAPVGRPYQVDASACVLLGELAKWQRETGGTFDPAIGRLLEAWDVHGSGRVPTDAELTRARSASGFDRLGFEASDCTVTRTTDVLVDVGGFGKGEAIDRAARAFGENAWLIDLGGQVSAWAGSHSTGWPVSVAHPLSRDRAHLNVTIRHGSVSTSGRSERDRMVAGIAVSHILDPRTGHPSSFTGSVTVWHERALIADILSTALFVMGPEEGMRWAAKRGLGVCYQVPSSHGATRVLMTPAFRTAVLSSNQR